LSTAPTPGPARSASRDVLDLLSRVVTVSLETVKIVDALPPLTGTE
jgi:hypothetical protein